MTRRAAGLAAWLLTAAMNALWVWAAPGRSVSAPQLLVPAMKSASKAASPALSRPGMYMTCTL